MGWSDVCLLSSQYQLWWLWENLNAWPGNPYGRGRLSTVDLLVLTSLDKLLFILKYYFPFYKTSYLNEEVNCTEPSPSVSVPLLSSFWLHDTIWHPTLTIWCKTIPTSSTIFSPNRQNHYRDHIRLYDLYFMIPFQTTIYRYLTLLIS